MNPQQFWKNSFKEVNLYCQITLIRLEDEFKQQVNLQEAVTDKMINSNPMLFKEPEIPRLINMFKELFKNNEDEEVQSIEEQIAILRTMK